MTTTKPQSTTEPDLKPCRCGRRALIERFHDGDDPQPLFVATCEVCPVKTYDQFTADEAARVWNEFVSATVSISDGQWQHVQIKAGNPRVVAIQFETAEQATAFINSFAASPVVDAMAVAREWFRRSNANVPEAEVAALTALISEHSRKIIETFATMRQSSLWNADGYNAALTNALDKVSNTIAAATAAPQQPRSNHFPNEALNRGFPDHISRDGTAYYSDGTVLPSAAPVEQSDEYTEISCAGCGRDTDTKLLLCPTCVDSGYEGAR